MKVAQKPRGTARFRRYELVSVCGIWQWRRHSGLLSQRVDFASLLPITLPMNDLFRREKFAHLPRAISEQGKRTHDYAVGTIGYWPPGPDVAIFYRQDGERIPDPGLIVLGKIKAGVEALNMPGAIRATIELS